MKFIDLVKNSINTICAKYLNEKEEIEYLPIFYIAGSQTLPPPLPPEEEAEFIEKLADEDNLEARQILVERNLRLVVYIAKKFENTGIGIEDLISIGTIGLMKGVNTFNSEKKIKLATYASRCIENEILMFFRNCKKSAQDVSMNEPIDTDKDGNALILMDVMATEDLIVDELDTKIKSEQLYRYIDEVLSERERIIINLRYGLGGKIPLTQREVAKKLNISRSYVSRIEKKSLLTLKKRFNKG